MSAGGVMTRGWCPGVLRPMASGDGLIVRLKISCGIVDVALAERIALWSQHWGNGNIELSNRANLQLRGIAPARLPDLTAALARHALLDGSEDGEAVRNVVSSPLAGLDPEAVLDIRPIARALERRLSGDASLHGLPAKFGFAIDDGGRLGLDDVAADVRFVARRVRNGPVFGIRLGGAPDHFGPCQPDTVVETAAAIAGAFLQAQRQTGVRRMRDLVAATGVGVVAQAAGLGQAGALRSGRAVSPSDAVGVHPLGAGAFVGVGLPFGRVHGEAFARLAAAAAAHRAAELRLTPWRAILVPTSSVAAAYRLKDGLAACGLILDPLDPRLRIAACPGAPACPQGATRALDDAATLASDLAAEPGNGVAVHVSGCEKGCAHPKAAPLTLVGRGGRYDLVRDGTASDRPVVRGLTLTQARAQIRGDAA